VEKMRLNWFGGKPNVEKLLKKSDVDGLIKALGDEDEGVRVLAAQALGKTFDLRAVNPLTVALKDVSVQVRRCAAGSLGKIGGWRALRPFREALGNTDAQVRQYAAEFLGSFEYGRDSQGRMDSRDSFFALEGLLKDADGEVKRAAEEARSRIVERNPSLKTEDGKGKEEGQLSGKVVVTFGKYKASFPEDYFKSSVEKEVFDPTKCALCGKKRSEKELRSVKNPPRSFCLDTCWSKRGQIIGSKLESAKQCPYYSEGMCTAGGDNICSLQFGTYNSACFVYKMKRTGAI
jgi:hypothetical protein